jgi:hypothetical protein
LREMNENEITALFIANLDTRESGSFFAEQWKTFFYISLLKSYTH